MGIDVSDFYACIEGKPGDLRVHLGKWMRLGPGPVIHAISQFPRNESKGIRRPRVDVFELEDARADMSQITVAHNAGWYIINSTSDAEKAEAWSVLGLVNADRGRCRHSAYAFNQALVMIDGGGQAYATLVERMATLAHAAGDVEIAKNFQAHAVALHMMRGSTARVLRSVVAEFSDLYSRELNRVGSDPTQDRLALLSGLVKSQVNALRRVPLPR